jgi:hypothetical protein
MRTTGAKLKFGSAVDTTIEASAGASAGVYAVGDMVLRVPASGKAFLIKDPTAVPTAGTELITKTALDSAVTSGISGGNLMPTAGTVHTAAQTLGCSIGNFVVKTGTDTPTATRLTIVPSGAATFSGALTVNGGTTLDTTLVVTGTTTLNQEVTVNSSYNITAGKAPSAANHLANKTYVDGSIDSISDTDARLPIKKLLMQVPIRQFVIGAITAAAGAVITTSGMTVNVPKYFPIFHSSGGSRNTSLTVLEGHQIIILEQQLTAGGTTFAYTKSALFAPESPVAAMLAYRIDNNSMTTTGTFTRVSVGSVLTGGVGGTSFQLNLGGGATIEYVLMRIA